jgi:hypothetical protein
MKKLISIVFLFLLVSCGTTSTSTKDQDKGNEALDRKIYHYNQQTSLEYWR